MNSFLKPILLAAVMASAGSVAHADTFNLSGNFGTTTYSGPLNGGSFSGTYDFDGMSFTSFNISLIDAGGKVLANIDSANGAVSRTGANPSDPTLIRVSFASDSVNTDLLALNFSAPFTGAGLVHLGSGSYISFANVGGYVYENVSAVTGGVAVAAVPEPATWGLMGLGLLAAGGVARRRQQA
jgi:hypothetical protein